MPIRIENSRFANGPVGIRSRGPVDIVLNNVTFDNVGQAFDVNGARSVDVRGTRIRNDPKITRTSGGVRSSTGWRRLDAPPLPAFCPDCKTVFPSRNYQFSGQYFNFWGNEETCPVCGFEHARLSEGAFDLARNTVRILSAPDMTYAMLAAINGVANDLASGRTTPKNAVRKFKAISPSFGALAAKAAKDLTVLTFLCAFVGVFLALGGDYLQYQAVELAKEQVALQKEANAFRMPLLRALLKPTGMALHPKTLCLNNSWKNSKGFASSWLSKHRNRACARTTTSMAGEARQALPEAPRPIH